MSQPHHLVRPKVVLAPADWRVFAAAARILARIMGAQAPNVAALIRWQLSGRDAIGVADDYLDSVRWPLEEGCTALLQRSWLKPRRKGPRKTASRQPRRAPRPPRVDNRTEPSPS